MHIRQSVFFRVDLWPLINKRILLSLLLAMCFLLTNQAAAAPRIVCEKPTYDFGTQISGAAITNRFILNNKGDEPLVISKIKNCCGVQTTVEPMTLPPGSNAVCTSVFTTKNRYGTQDKQILLATNDRKKPYYELKIIGTLLQPVEIRPRWIRLGNLLSDGEINEIITATNILEKVIALESVSSTVPGLEVEVVRDGASRLHAMAEKNADRISTLRRDWMIRLKSSGPLTAGKMSGQVKLNFSTGPVIVPVIGTVIPIIQATPDKIAISSGRSKEVERIVMLRSGDGRSFNVLSAHLEHADGKVDAQKLADGKWTVTLSVQPGSIQPEAFIIIKTSIESQSTISIPLGAKWNPGKPGALRLDA